MRKKYQKGGKTKQDWVSNKIGTLVNEGYPKDQAVAIAFSMYQTGGFKYDKIGNTPITQKDMDRVNEVTGIQFTPEFSQAYFSTDVTPPAPVQKRDISQMPIMDITMGGHGERRVWNIRPENLVGNSEPQEGKHYYNVYPKQWEAYQKSPEYLNYINKGEGGLASMSEGGEIPKYQTAGWGPFNGNYGIQPPTGVWEKAVEDYKKTQVTKPPVAKAPTTQATKPTALARPPMPTDASMEEIVTPENTNESKYGLDTALKGEMLTDWGNNLNADDVANPYILNTQSTSSGDIQGYKPYQFNNPYGEVNLGQAAGYLGESIKNKDAQGIVVSGLKLGTGLARNLLSGMGEQNRQNQIMKSYYEGQRDTATQSNKRNYLYDQGYGENFGYYQNGGDWSSFGDMDPETYDDYGRLNTNYFEQEPSYNYFTPPVATNTSNQPPVTQSQPLAPQPQPGKEVWQVWQEKTGLPWKDAKRLGYTDGTAKDNLKLLQEINSETFDVSKLRKAPQQKVKEKEPTSYTGKPEEGNYWGTNKKQDIPQFWDKPTLEEKEVEKAPTSNKKEKKSNSWWESVQDYLTAPVYFQEGGEMQQGQEEVIAQVQQALQQGAAPEEVLQQLVQMGIPEDQAAQLIQGIMQQMQQQPQMQKGGTYFDQLKGKRIVDYKYNERTGNYDISYED